jgi:hypothetical protein
MSNPSVTAYKYGPYTFGVTKSMRISGLCGESFKNESDLLDSYDEVLGDYDDNPPLFRVYADGNEVQLRPKGGSHEMPKL